MKAKTQLEPASELSFACESVGVAPRDGKDNFAGFGLETNEPSPMADEDESLARKLIGDGSEPLGTKEKLVDVAIELFYRHGIHAVALDQILSRVGTTKTTFYKYFESKDDLVFAALQKRDSWELEWFHNAIKELDHSDPCESLLAAFDVLHLWFTDSRFDGLQFINAAAQFPLRNDPVRKLAKKHMFALQMLLHDTAKTGSFEKPEELSKQLLLLLEGSLSVRFVLGDDTAAHTARKLAAFAIETCLNGSVNLVDQ